MASSSSSKPPSYLLPYTTLQPTYFDVHADVKSGSVTAEDVFLSIYADNAPQKSIHATLRLMQGPEEAPVELEVVKGGVGLVAIEEVGAEQPRDLSVSTTAHAAAKHQPTSPIHLQNGPVLDQGVRLRLPRVTRSRLLQGTRSQAALDRGAGGTISAFDVAAGASEGSFRFVVAGEEGECRVGGFAMAASSSGSSSGSAGDAAMESVEERAQRRMAEKAATQGAKAVDVKGHVGDVQKARFFPSGKVMLTATNDGQIRLYPVSPPTPQPARSFRGHRRAVTGLSILGRGKRFLSSSRDGTVKLWDVPGEKCLTTLSTSRVSPVESLAVLPLEHDEVEATGSWVVFAGTAAGAIEAFSLNIQPSPVSQDDRAEDAAPPLPQVTSRPLSSMPATSYPSDLPEGVTGPGSTDHWSLVPSSAVWSLDVCAGEGTAWLVAGTKMGIVRLFEVDVSSVQQEDAQLAREHCNVRRNDAGINAVRFMSAPSSGNAPDVVIATTDGTPYRLNWQSGVPRVAEEYTGWEAGDAVEEIALARGTSDEDTRVALAGAEGCVRVY